MNRILITVLMVAALSVPSISADQPNPAQPLADALFAELNMTAPALPRMPEVPSEPGVPETGVPALPSLPSLPEPTSPALPELPSLPEPRTPQQVEALRVLILAQVAQMTCPAAVEVKQHAIGGTILDTDSTSWGFITTRHVEDIIERRVPIYEEVRAAVQPVHDGLLKDVVDTADAATNDAFAAGDLLFDEAEGQTGVDARRIIGWQTVKEVREGHADITMVGNYDREFIDWERFDRTVTVDLDSGMWFLLHDDANLVQVCDEETEVLDRLPAWDAGDFDYFAWWTGYYGKWVTNTPGHSHGHHAHGHHHHWNIHWYGDDGWYVVDHDHDAWLTTAADYEEYQFLDTCRWWNSHCHGHLHYFHGHGAWTLPQEALELASVAVGEVVATVDDAMQQELIRNSIGQVDPASAGPQAAGAPASAANLVGLIGLGSLGLVGPAALRFLRKP